MGWVIVGYLILHPLLQISSLLRCRGGWRVASLVGLVTLGPLYFWSLFKVLGPKLNGDLSGMLILLFAPFSLLYLGVVAAGGEVCRSTLPGD